MLAKLNSWIFPIRRILVRPQAGFCRWKSRRCRDARLLGLLVAQKAVVYARSSDHAKISYASNKQTIASFKRLVFVFLRHHYESWSERRSTSAAPLLAFFVGTVAKALSHKATRDISQCETLSL
jgi:hypothetical protein